MDYVLLFITALVQLSVDGKYGVVVKGKLIPEVVKHGKVEIGRFEVTRAQYIAWDNGYPMKAGTENLPANGITPPQATGYAEWLSGLTGQTWRLPHEDEIKGVSKLDSALGEWVVGKDGKSKIAGSRGGEMGFRVLRAAPK